MTNVAAGAGEAGAAEVGEETGATAGAAVSLVTGLLCGWLFWPRRSTSRNAAVFPAVRGFQRATSFGWSERPRVASA